MATFPYRSREGEGRGVEEGGRPDMTHFVNGKGSAQRNVTPEKCICIIYIVIYIEPWSVLYGSWFNINNSIYYAYTFFRRYVTLGRPLPIYEVCHIWATPSSTPLPSPSRERYVIIEGPRRRLRLLRRRWRRRRLRWLWSDPHLVRTEISQMKPRESDKCMNQSGRCWGDNRISRHIIRIFHQIARRNVVKKHASSSLSH